MDENENRWSQGSGPLTAAKQDVDPKPSKSEERREEGGEVVTLHGISKSRMILVERLN